MEMRAIMTKKPFLKSGLPTNSENDYIRLRLTAIQGIPGSTRKNAPARTPFRGSQLVPWLASSSRDLGCPKARAQPAVIRRQLPHHGGRYAQRSIANGEGISSSCCADPVRRIRALRLRAIRGATLRARQTIAESGLA